MAKITGRLASLLAGVCMVCASGAQAQDFTANRIFVLGDSLSDGGTYSQAVIAGAPIPLPPILYRFTTNAPDGSSRVYAEALAASLGLPLDPNVVTGLPGVPPALGGPIPAIPLGGTNFAQGGSRVSQQPGVAFDPNFGITTIPVSQQVSNLLAATPRLGPNDLVVLWAGANDAFVQGAAVVGPGDIPTAIAGMQIAADDLATQIGVLKAAGASKIMLVTLPDLGSTPDAIAAGPQAQALFSALSSSFNAELLTATAGQNVLILDAGRLLAAVLAEPVRFGFTAPNAATVPACAGSALTCLQGLNATADSELRVFADGVHPTTAAHAVFGQLAFSVLRAATQNGAMPVAALTSLRQGGPWLEDRLTPMALMTNDGGGGLRRREHGHAQWRMDAELAHVDTDGGQVLAEQSTDAQTAWLGVDVALGEGSLLGLDLRLDHGRVAFSGGIGGFETRSFGAGLYGMTSLNDTFYLNGAASAGAIEFYDIERNVALGAATEHYSADTSGFYVSARVGGGAMLPISEGLTLNPNAAFTFERVTVDGYAEPLGAASLAFGDAEIESQRLSLGLAAFYQPAAAPDWSATIRGSYEHDFNQDAVSVNLGPDPATLASLPVDRPNGDYGAVSAKISHRLGEASELSLGGAALFGADSTGFSGGLEFRMAF